MLTTYENQVWCNLEYIIYSIIPSVYVPNVLAE